MRIEWTALRGQARRLCRWRLDHPPQTALSLMAFVMISSHMNFWLAWFVLACFAIGSIGLICMMLRDIVRDDHARGERWRQREEAQRWAMRRVQDKLAARRASKCSVADQPLNRQSDQDEA